MDSKTFKCPYARKRKDGCDETFSSREQASRHVIEAHHGGPIHIREGGQYLCLYTKSFGTAGCRETFPSQESAVEHLKQMHSNEKNGLPCPLSENCKTDHRTFDGLACHVRDIHLITAHKCTWAGCEATFGTPSSVLHHVKGVHKGERIPCPINGCEMAFIKQPDVNQHVESFHEKKRHWCSWGGCKKNFTTTMALKDHVTTDHEGQKYQCPFEYCPVERNDRSSITKHLKRDHRGERLPCKVEGCQEAFPDRKSAKKHAETKHRNAYPCPDDECAKLFKDEAEASKHWEERHGYHGFICRTCGGNFCSPRTRQEHETTHSHPFVCPHVWCRQRFDNWDKALMHAERQDHEPSETLYTCPLKDCSISVTGRALPKAGLKRNWHNHVDRGHISDIVELVYKPAEQLQFRPLPSYRTIFEHSTKGHSEHDGSPGVTPPSEEPLVGSEDSIGNEDDFESSEDIILQFEEEEEDVDRTEENRVELFSPEHRSQILAQNEEYWSQRKDQNTLLHGRGRICAGPGLETMHFIKEPCPLNMVIDLDTARLRQRQMKKGSRIITLDLECVACAPTKRSRIVLRHLESEEEKMARFNPKSLRKTFESAARI